MRPGRRRLIVAQPALCADQIHPNAEGYRQMAAGIAARLREIGLR